MGGSGYLFRIVMGVFVPGVRKFNDDSDSRWCRHDRTLPLSSGSSSRVTASMSLPTDDASDQDYTLELRKFIEDLSQIPDKTPVVSELEGMLNSKVQKF